MIAATALILLAEAATACTVPGAARLGGDALLVRPIGTREPAPFIRLGPATRIVTRSMEIQQISATTGTAEASPRTQQCAAVVIPIV